MRNWIILSFFAVCLGCANTELKKEQADLHLRIGTSHLLAGRYPQALNEMLAAETLDPENPVIENNLGLAYFVRKEFTQAEKHLLLALTLNPKYNDARNNLGRVHIELARYDEALAELKIVTQDLTYPTPEKAFVNIGIVYMKKGSPLKALDNFKKGIEANGKFCPAFNYYGQSLLGLQK